MTLEEIKVYIEDDTLKSDDVALNRYLSESLADVMRDGVDESHADFNKLQRLKVLSYIQNASFKKNTTSGTSAVSSVNLGGLSVGFPEKKDYSQALNKSNSYQGEYDALLRQIKGLQGRIV